MAKQFYTIELSMYYITAFGELCITFPSIAGKSPELCKVVGLHNETWFKHVEIK